MELLNTQKKVDQSTNSSNEYETFYEQHLEASLKHDILAGEKIKCRLRIFSENDCFRFEIDLTSTDNCINKEEQLNIRQEILNKNISLRKRIGDHLEEERINENTAGNLIKRVNLPISESNDEAVKIKLVLNDENPSTFLSTHESMDQYAQPSQDTTMLESSLSFSPVLKEENSFRVSLKLLMKG